MSGSIPRDLGKRLRAGVELDDGPVKVDSFTVVDTHAGQSVVQATSSSGTSNRAGYSACLYSFRRPLRLISHAGVTAPEPQFACAARLSA